MSFFVLKLALFVVGIYKKTKKNTWCVNEKLFFKLCQSNKPGIGRSDGRSVDRSVGWSVVDHEL